MPPELRMTRPDRAQTERLRHGSARRRDGQGEGAVEPRLHGGQQSGKRSAGRISSSFFFFQFNLFLISRSNQKQTLVLCLACIPDVSQHERDSATLRATSPVREHRC